MKAFPSFEMPSLGWQPMTRIQIHVFVIFRQCKIISVQICGTLHTYAIKRSPTYCHLCIHRRCYYIHSLCQTPPRRKSQFSNSQIERAVVQAQTRTRQLRSLGSEGRKANSILINHSSKPLPLMNTCSSLHLMISLIFQEKLFLSMSRSIKPAHMFTF